MKKTIALITFFLCIQLNFSYESFVKAEEVSLENESLNDSVVYTTGLINGYSIAISSNDTSLLLMAKMSV